MKPEYGENQPDKNMCRPHGNFLPCRFCDENIKENGIENTAESEKTRQKRKYF